VALLLPLCAIPALLVLVELAVDHGLYRWHYRRQRNAGRPVTFAFGAEALDWSVGDMSGRIAWTAVRRLRDDGSRLYVHVDPVTAVAVPRGDLDDAARAERVRIARTGAGIPA
jgi:hypothetical protein